VATDSEFFRSLLDNFYDGVYFVDRQRCITYWNKGAERISGYTAAEAVGSHCYDQLLNHIDDDGTCLCQGSCPLARTIEDGSSREAEIYLHHKAGHRVPVLVRITPIVDPDGAVIGAIEVFSDNSAKMSALHRVQDLEKVAYVDQLTGLANRALTEITLRSRTDELSRYGWPFGVLFIDIDQFKLVNDRLGHNTGDAVLQAVANTLRGAARTFDLVGRWGGEEFVAIIANTDNTRLTTIAERFRTLVEASVVSAGGAEHVVTVSIGGTQAAAGETVETLIARADALMYASKKSGRNRVTIG
jgi:diguanylate cyclase (GGDEF)-like protein/PAS domain S-box-containing protein